MKSNKLVVCLALALGASPGGGCGDDVEAEPARDASAHRAPDASGDADAEAEPVTRWVGDVEDSDIRLGAVIEGTRARLFFCGGPSSYASATRWLVAPIDADGNVDVDDMGWRLNARLERQALSGELSAPGADSRGFTARPIRADTLAGLYEGEAECGRLGLIVTQPTRSAKAEGQGACVGPGHPPEQVNPILPIALDAGEIAVEIDGSQARVRAAAPPM